MLSAVQVFSESLVYTLSCKYAVQALLPLPPPSLLFLFFLLLLNLFSLPPLSFPFPPPFFFTKQERNSKQTNKTNQAPSDGQINTKDHFIPSWK